jgi:hypothetical protein
MKKENIVVQTNYVGYRQSSPCGRLYRWHMSFSRQYNVDSTVQDTITIINCFLPTCQSVEVTQTFKTAASWVV